MSFIRILALLAVLAATSAGLSACGGGGGESPPTTAQGIAENASFDGIEGADLEVSLLIQQPGEELHMKILGPFQSMGGDRPPQLDLAVEGSGDFLGRKFESFGGLLLRTEKAVVNYERQTYEPPPAIFRALKSKFEEGREEGGAAEAGACFEAAAHIKLARLVTHWKNAGHGPALDGTPVTFLSGDLDLRAAIDALLKLLEDPACGPQLRALGVPSAATLEAVKRGLGDIHYARVQWTVGRDGILRGLSVHLKGKDAMGRLEAEFRVLLSSVNELNGFADSRGYAPFGSLLKKFGLDSQKVLAASPGEALLSFLEVVGDSLTGRGS